MINTRRDEIRDGGGVLQRVLSLKTYKRERDSVIEAHSTWKLCTFGCFGFRNLGSGIPVRDSGGVLQLLHLVEGLQFRV